MKGKWFGMLAAVLMGALSFGQGCPKGDMDKAFWQAIKSSNFAVPSGRSADELATVLIGCLASPDPELRDGLAYETLTAWFRGGRLSVPAMKTIARTLVQNLKSGTGEVGTDTVFLRSFSALILSEAIRQDSRASYLDAPEFAEVLGAGIAYLPAERDWRGFDNKLGYIHAVAHGSDLLWRLASSSKTTVADLQRILDAVASKVAPPGEHFYVYGESERLARVLIFALNRGLLDTAWVKSWIKKIAEPGSLGSWGNAYSSQASLARLHNTKQFVLTLYSNFEISKAQIKGASELLPTVIEALQAVSV